MKCVNLIGAKGGQGTSTLACAVALHAAGQGQRVSLNGNHPDDHRAILGLAPHATAAEGVTLMRDGDIEPLADGTDLYVTDNLPVEGGTSVLVVRNDYMALRRAMYTGGGRGMAGAVLFMEPGRALTERDVEGVLIVPVLTTVHLTRDGARAIDAGLFTARQKGWAAVAEAVLAVAL